MNKEDASLGGPSIRNAALRNLFKGKLSACATLSPLILALIVAGGLGILCVENLVSPSVRHMNYDHSEAIFKLLFRS